jgi:hypothetical protein
MEQPYADLDQRLGFQLAGSVSLCRARPLAQGNPHRDAVHLRQFVRDPHNPSSPPKRVTFGEQTTDEMALLLLQAVLPHPEDAVRFRQELIFSRLDQFLSEGGRPAGVTPRVMEILQSLAPRFDANHNGALDPEERATMLRFMATRIK